MPASAPIEERFWPKVRKGPGCWEWTDIAVLFEMSVTNVCEVIHRKTWRKVS